MATIYKEAVLNVGIDGPWARIADVGRAHELISILESTAVDGEYRRIAIKGGGTLRERIVTIDEAHHRVAYTIEDSPFGFEFHGASMQLIEEGPGSCRVLWITDFKPDGLASVITPIFDGAFEDLKAALAKP